MYKMLKYSNTLQNTIKKINVYLQFNSYFYTYYVISLFDEFIIILNTEKYK